MQVAQDTFVIEIGGHDVQVAKGSLWDNAHPVVLKDKGGILFKPLGDASAPVLAAEG